MPYSSSDSAEDPVLTEIRLCLWAAAGCSLVGGAALAYGWLRGERVSLTALLPVAGLYLAMACERAFKRWRTTRGDSRSTRTIGSESAVNSSISSSDPPPVAPVEAVGHR